MQKRIDLSGGIQQALEGLARGYILGRVANDPDKAIKFANRIIAAEDDKIKLCAAEIFEHHGLVRPGSLDQHASVTIDHVITALRRAAEEIAKPT